MEVVNHNQIQLLEFESTGLGMSCYYFRSITTLMLLLVSPLFLHSLPPTSKADEAVERIAAQNRSEVLGLAKRRRRRRGMRVG